MQSILGKSAFAIKKDKRTTEVEATQLALFKVLNSDKKYEKVLEKSTEETVKDKDSISYFNRKYSKNEPLIVIPGSFYKVRA